MYLKGHSPVRVGILEKYLSDYPLRRDAELLLDGFRDGFKLNYTGPRIGIWSKNLHSAQLYKNETLDKLTKEVQLGRMIGPFSQKPIANLRISPIGLVPKSDNKFRLITHLSYPNQFSVNDFIDENLCKVKYTSFDSVIDMIANLGQSALIAKVDISQAFRLLPINPTDFDLLGISFESKFYIDKCLPMGCAISCALFEKFSSFIHWVVKNETQLDTLDHYLDDFIFAGGISSNDCYILMTKFLEVAQEMGVPIAENKTVGPTTVLEFLGLEIDTVLMMVRIPSLKLHKLKSLIGNMLSMKKITVKQFESIIGLMSFCARAIPSARAFLRRFYDLLASLRVRKPYYLIRVTQEVKQDAQVWMDFLNDFNGECYIPDKLWVSNEVLELFTDAAGRADLGCAAYLAGQWIQYRWPTEWANTDKLKDISFLELIPIILALYTWASKFENKNIIFRTDNQALVAVINKRTSKSKLVMQLIRPLVLFTLHNNTQFKARHIVGSINIIADSLSRFQDGRFRAAAPNAEQNMMPMPMKFLEIISKMT